MSKPYVVCHMLTSLNGKIDGSFMVHPDNAISRKLYGKIRKDYAYEAVIYGQVTMKELYADEITFNDSMVHDVDDYIDTYDSNGYIVSIDPFGTLEFETNYTLNNGKKSHFIQVLSKKVSKEYLEYLKLNNISYLICGDHDIDISVLLDKLGNYFGIKKVLVAGGGKTNDSFIQQNKIDEISLVISPCTESNEAATTFESLHQNSFSKSYKLSKVEILENDTVWIRYRKQKER